MEEIPKSRDPVVTESICDIICEFEVMWAPPQNRPVGQQPGQRGRALFDYAAQASNQMSLRRGQIIGVISFGAKGEWSNGVNLETGMSINYDF